MLLAETPSPASTWSRTTLRLNVYCPFLRPSITSKGPTTWLGNEAQKLLKDCSIKLTWPNCSRSRLWSSLSCFIEQRCHSGLSHKSRWLGRPVDESTRTSLMTGGPSSAGLAIRRLVCRSIRDLAAVQSSLTTDHPSAQLCNERTVKIS